MSIHNNQISELIFGLFGLLVISDSDWFFTPVAVNLCLIISQKYVIYMVQFIWFIRWWTRVSFHFMAIWYDTKQFIILPTLTILLLIRYVISTWIKTFEMSQKGSVSHVLPSKRISLCVQTSCGSLLPRPPSSEVWDRGGNHAGRPPGAIRLQPSGVHRLQLERLRSDVPHPGRKSSPLTFNTRCFTDGLKIKIQSILMQYIYSLEISNAPDNHVWFLIQ